MPTVDAIQQSKKFASPWYFRRGLVYFVSAGSDCERCKAVKIGVTAIEGLLRRLRSHGTVGAEWFDATPEVMDCIEKESMLPADMTEMPGLATILKLFV